MERESYVGRDEKGKETDGQTHGLNGGNLSFFEYDGKKYLLLTISCPT